MSMKFMVVLFQLLNQDSLYGLQVAIWSDIQHAADGIQ